MIDELILAYVSASDEERAEFHKKVAQCGISADELVKASDVLCEIARNI